MATLPSPSPSPSENNSDNSTTIDIKKTIIEFLGKNKQVVAAYVFLTLAVTMLNIYLPHMYGQVIEQINKNRAIAPETREKIIYIVGLWVIVQSIHGVISMLDSQFIPRMRSHIRQYIVAKVINAYKEDFEEQELGGPLEDIIELPNELELFMYDIQNNIMPITFLLILTVLYFGYISPTLGLVTFACFGTYITVSIYFILKSIPHWESMDTQHRHLQQEVNDSFGNLLNIYTTGQDKDEQSRLNIIDDEFTRRHSHASKFSAKVRYGLSIGYIAMFSVINMTSAYLYSTQKIGLNNVITILIISLEIMSKMSNYVYSIDDVVHQVAIIGNSQKLLNRIINRRYNANVTQHAPNLTMGNIVFDNVSINYHGKEIIKNLSFTIDRNEIVLLNGEIGSGKTTLVNALIRLIPYTGKITIGGHDIQNINIDYLRTKVIYIPQNPRLLNRTVYDNIAYGKNVTKERIQSILDTYHIKLNLDRPVGKFGSALSGGQRQIVLLLRCMVSDSPIIILDEPTASLDQKSKNSIFKILEDILTNRTVIIISHDPHMQNYAHRIINISAMQSGMTNHSLFDGASDSASGDIAIQQHEYDVSSSHPLLYYFHQQQPQYIDY